MNEHIKICIFLFLYFQNVVSYKIYQLDSAEGTKLLPKIRQIILNQRNGEPHYENKHVRHGKREHPGLEAIGEKVFVKRIIPHGYSTGVYEYDPKLNTVFKPIARYHVKKPIEEHERSILKDLEHEQKQKDRADKDLVVLVQKEKNQIELLNSIQNFLNQNTMQQNRKKKKVKARFRGLFNKFGKNALLLLRQKSGEQHDPFAPGKLPPELQQQPSAETAEKVTYATYPYWNYWTYSKNIYQDRCPGHLVRVGNMCISSIGHRKSANPSQSRRSSRKKHKGSHSIRSSRKKHLYGKK